MPSRNFSVPAPSVPLLEAEGLMVFRAERPVLRGVSLQVKPGEILRVTGPNGSGKTTLLRTLAGLLRPDGGRLLRAASIGWMGVADGLNPALSLTENLAFYGFGRERETEIRAVLEKLGLEQSAGRPVAELSTGQSRRGCWARLLLEDAPLWILDEPERGIDAGFRPVLWRFLEQAREQGKAILLASHFDLPAAMPRKRLRLADGKPAALDASR